MSIGWSSIASAHATLLRSTPGAGQLIATSPSMIRLVFSEQIVGDMSSIHLVSADGTRSRLQTMVDPRDVHALVAVSPPLSSSSYRVVWRIISADGHPISDSFTFRLLLPGVVTPRMDQVTAREGCGARGSDRVWCLPPRKADAHTPWYFPKTAAPRAYRKYVLRVPNEKDVATTLVEIRFPAGLGLALRPGREAAARP